MVSSSSFVMRSNNYSADVLPEVFPSFTVQDQMNNGSLLSSGSIQTSVNSDMGIRSKMMHPSNLSSGLSNHSTFQAEDRSRTNLIINYLPQSYDQGDLQRLFERIGPIRQCKLIRDKNTGASLCYGFVDFQNPEDASIAIQTYHGYETEQKRLRVAYASSGGRRGTNANPNHPSLPLDSAQRQSFLSQGLKVSLDGSGDCVVGWEICVTGVPIEWSESDLHRLFKNFGNVVFIRLLPASNNDAIQSKHKLLGSSILNGTQLDSDSVDCSFSTATASVILEEKSSAESAVLRLNNVQASDWISPLCIRLIGSVTKETLALFCLSRQSVLNQMPLGDPSSEAAVLNSILSTSLRRNILNAPSNVNVTDSLIDRFAGLNVDGIVDNCFDGHSDVKGQSYVPLSRPIVRTKGASLLDSSPALGYCSNGLHSLDSFDGSHQSSQDRSSPRNSFEMKSHPCVRQFLEARDIETKSPLWASTTLSSGSSQQRMGGGSFINRSNISDTASGKRLILRSPLITSPTLSYFASQRNNGRANVFLKLENLLPTGSFKIRGMENVCRKLALSGPYSHVVCPSNGNAGVSAAVAAHAYGLGCTVIVPETEAGTDEASTRRRLALEAPQAKLLIAPGSGAKWTESFVKAEQLVSERNSSLSSHNGETIGLTKLVHPFDSSDLWEGYESIIEELAADLGQPDAIVVSVGGGGLLAGIIQGLWNQGWQTTHVITAETDGADCLAQSLRLGHVVPNMRCSSIATSLAASYPAPRALSLAQCHQALTAYTCSDASAIDAIKRFADDHGMLVEPACGAALSAVYSGVIGRLQAEDRLPRVVTVVVLVCGGRTSLSLQQMQVWDKMTRHSSDAAVSGVDSVLPLHHPGTLFEAGARHNFAHLNSNAVQASHQHADLNETLKLSDLTLGDLSRTGFSSNHFSPTANLTSTALRLNGFHLGAPATQHYSHILTTGQLGQQRQRNGSIHSTASSIHSSSADSGKDTACTTGSTNGGIVSNGGNNLPLHPDTLVNLVGLLSTGSIENDSHVSHRQDDCIINAKEALSAQAELNHIRTDKLVNDILNNGVADDDQAFSTDSSVHLALEDKH